MSSTTTEVWASFGRTRRWATCCTTPTLDWYCSPRRELVRYSTPFSLTNRYGTTRSQGLRITTRSGGQFYRSTTHPSWTCLRLEVYKEPSTSCISRASSQRDTLRHIRGQWSNCISTTTLTTCTLSLKRARLAFGTPRVWLSLKSTRPATTWLFKK